MKLYTILVTFVALYLSQGLQAQTVEKICDDCIPLQPSLLPTYVVTILTAAGLDLVEELGPSGMVHLPTEDAFVAFSAGLGYESLDAFLSDIDPAILAAYLRYHLVPFSVLDSQILSFRGFQVDSALSPQEFQLVCGVAPEGTIFTTLINKNEQAVVAKGSTGAISDVLEFCGPYIVRFIDKVLDPCAPLPNA